MAVLASAIPSQTVGVAVRIRFLTGAYHAASAIDGLEVAEWPPHPARLFAALVSAHHALGAPVDTEAAVGWIERAEPPEIACDADAAPRVVSRTFVLPSDGRVAPQSERQYASAMASDSAGKRYQRKARYEPATVLAVAGQDASVWFRWRQDAPGAVLAGLKRLVCEIPYLGASDSLVCVTVESPANMPAAEFLPCAPDLSPPRGASLYDVRVPWKGLRVTLDGAYGAGDGDQRPPRRLRPTGVISYRRASAEDEVASSGMEIVATVPLVGTARAPVEACGKLARELRRRMLAVCDDDAPAVLHGHEQARGHAAYLPVPWVDERRADGEVVAVMLALPAAHIRECSDSERNATRDALARVRPFRVHGIPGTVGLGASAGASPPLRAYLGRFLTSSRCWVTATPAVYERHLKRPEDFYPMIARMCANAGLPAPIEAVELRGASARGASVARAADEDRERPEGRAAHLLLRFATPVRGPVVIGRGRFLGYGLCIARDEDGGENER